MNGRNDKRGDFQLRDTEDKLVTVGHNLNATNTSQQSHTATPPRHHSSWSNYYYSLCSASSSPSTPNLVTCLRTCSAEEAANSNNSNNNNIKEVAVKLLCGQPKRMSVCVYEYELMSSIH